jgi:hypothetical protein
VPDRLIRDEILESERWLRLKDNADRLAFIALLLKADSYGNFSADAFRLMRLWRDFGINNEPHACKTLTELADADLVRLYEVDGKAYLHIPRFGQRARYFKRVFPISPWTIEHKQEVTNNSPVYSQVRTAEVKRSEEKRSEVDLGLSISPTRDKRNVKTVLKNIPEDQNQDHVERNRRLAIALASGDIELARAIKAGKRRKKR